MKSFFRNGAIKFMNFFSSAKPDQKENIIAQMKIKLLINHNELIVSPVASLQKKTLDDASQVSKEKILYSKGSKRRITGALS
jgi:hypothetical protein